MSEHTPPAARRIEAMKDLLVDQGVVSEEDLAAQLRRQEGETWLQGARLVARAWSNPVFRSLLLDDAKAAAREVGVDVDRVADFMVLENTEDVHHLVVCTLCSCYPRAVLGDPPKWYKSDEYRARAVREPRQVLAEFGVRLSEDVKVAVVDSSADRRFMVLPRQPQASEGLSEDDLVALVTRDSLVGAGEPLSP